MDKATLVKSDVDIEGRVLLALSRARIPVTLCDWHYVPQLYEWQLIIATPWYDTRGPREAFSKVVMALSEEGIYSDVPIRRVFLKSPGDPIVKELEKEARIKTEGAIHIVAHKSSHNGTQYSVMFSPFTGPGGAVPARHLSDTEELKEFLENRLHIARSSVEEALRELDRKANTSIFSVELTKREAKKAGLA